MTEKGSKMKRREFLKSATVGVGLSMVGRAAAAVAAKAADPQWIDLQVNGRVGISFTDDKLKEEDVLKVVEALRDGGTAGFLATIVTCPDEMAIHALRTIRKAMKKYPECERRIIGFHMEGPFVSNVPGYSGAHNKLLTRDCDVKVFDRWMDASDGMIKIVTIDGDRGNALEFTRHASAAGTVVSLGHTTTWKTEDLDKFAKAGAKTVTHLGNALPNELPRHHNMIWTALANPNYMPMFISDGFHLPKEMLHCYVRACPLERLVTVSDCSYPGGLPPGRYVRNGSVSVLEPSGFLRSPATNSLHGSSCLMKQCVATLMSPEVGLSPADCRMIAHDNPLRLIGMSGWSA